MSELLNNVFATQLFMINSKATSESYEESRNKLYKMGIKTFAAKNRMIFSAAHQYKKTINNPYVHECNGLILELGTWKPIMVPCRNMRFNIDTKESNKYLSQGLYKIYEAEDGTCFNMYYYDNEWCISTSNGYYMNNVKWETLTFQEIITDCLSFMNLTWDQFINSLDKSHCYSMGFRHEKYHKFRPQNKVWFIQSVNLDSKSDNYLWVNETSPCSSISTQNTYLTEVSNLKQLYKNASTALEDYIHNNLDICYGYILRSTSLETTGNHSDLFIESSLMKFIRTTWYDKHINQDCLEFKNNKEDYVTLNAYLDSSIYENFNILFPQYQPRMRYYNTLINLIVEYIVDNSKELKYYDQSENQIENENDNKNESYQKILDLENKPSESGLLYPKSNDIMEVGIMLVLKFIHKYKYNINSKTNEQKKRVLYEYITHPEHLSLLMSLIVHPLDQ